MMDDAKERVSRATDNPVKALQTGREALKSRSKAIYEERKFLEEELAALKRQSADMRRQLERSEERKTQLKIALDQEEKERRNYLAQAEYISRKTEQLKATYPRGREQYIQILRDEIEICKRRLFSEKPIEGKRIPDYEENYITRSSGGNMAAAWQESQGRTATTVLKDNFEGESMTIKPERECVMCLIEEASVLFLPCTHQVLCEGCNDLHKKGRNHCPSCNTQIQERIQARFEGY